jgi:hypothetical protein
VAPARTTAAFPEKFRVPAGEHLLVVVRDPDGSVNTDDDTTELPGGSAAQQRVKFYPRGGIPAMEVSIR